LRGVAITGLPGTQPYSVVYVASGEQVCEIGLWTQTPGLDARAHVLLGSLRFTPPTRSRAAAMADVEAGLITEGPHTIDAAPEAVAIASAPTEFTHPRKQGPPRCGLTQRICTHQPDKTFLNSGSIMYDAVFVPGGARSIAALRGDGLALHFINEAFRHCKAIGAAAEGVDLLLASNIGDPAVGTQASEQAPRGHARAGRRPHGRRRQGADPALHRRRRRAPPLRAPAEGARPGLSRARR